MANTGARYGITFNYSAGQNGWTTTGNYAMSAIDALISPWVLSTALSAPPGSPTEADTYVVATGGTGAWASQDNKLAAYQAGTWTFYPIPKGFRAYIVAGPTGAPGLFYWNGTAWTNEATTSSGAEVTSNKGVANGYAGLGSDGFVPWAQMKPEVQNLPLSFVLSGQPASGQILNLVMVQACSLPVNFAGVAIYAGTTAAATVNVTVNKIPVSTGTVGAIGTLGIAASSNTGVTVTAASATSFVAGDVLQLVFPGTQDATLANLGITLMAAKV